MLLHAAITFTENSRSYHVLRNIHEHDIIISDEYRGKKILSSSCIVWLWSAVITMIYSTMFAEEKCHLLQFIIQS